MDGTAGRSLLHLPGDTPRVLRASCKLCLAAVLGELGGRVCVCVCGGWVSPPCLGAGHAPLFLYSLPAFTWTQSTGFPSSGRRF